MSSNIYSGTVVYAPDLTQDIEEFPFDTPEVEIEGVAEYYFPQVLFDWDRMTINVSTKDRVITLHCFSYLELQRFDEEGNEIWESGMNAPYEDKEKGIVYSGRTRPAETFKLEVTDPNTGRKCTYKCVLESAEGPEPECGGDDSAEPWVFYGPDCGQLVDGCNLIVPEGVDEIDEAACIDDGYITSVRLPKSLRKIGTCAFLRTGLKEVTLPRNVEEIGSGAFAENENLTMVSFATGCNPKSIASGAFGQCPALETLLLQGDMEIDPNVFYEDDDIKHIFVEASPEETGESVKKFASAFPNATLYYYSPEGPLKDVPSWRYEFDQPGPVPWQR
ncbi:MAG: leucine-rich repeat domain-containing protein [Bacilli bacterium]|nr:leucine-rich repeat domain-containing protein [Bacilli bacterium]